MDTGSYLSNDMDEYILNHSSKEDPILYELNRFTHLTSLHPRMLSGPIQGKLLELICKMINPKRVLEIGTYTGYSAICMAKGLTDGAHIDTIEVNDEISEIALDFFKKANLDDRITLHLGDALNVIPTLHKTYDLILIDGDKRQYPQYLNAVLPILNPHSFIIADNVLWGGKVLDVNADDDYTQGVMKFNELVANNSNLEKVLLPIRDGLMLIRKL